MAELSKTPSFIKMANEVCSIARNRGLTHLFTQDNFLKGKEITIKNKTLINFGSCSYLGLEVDERLIEAGIDALRRYGSQFSSSRTYVSFTLYEELEELLKNIFGKPVILSSCSSLGHQAIIPIIIEDNDAVILDQQAHISMQESVQKLQLRGINISVLRHNRLDDLKKKIEELEVKHSKIWYFIDGIYSMYGDVAPIHELNIMLDKHKKLHLYIDDAHGMSWEGVNGAGYILSQIKLTSQVVLTTSLAKGFASAGGVFILPNEEMYWKVKNWGGALTYSGPQQPAVIGASIASAKIHLSPEIKLLQRSLREKITYCNGLMSNFNLPLISESIAPIFFIGLGLTKVAYNMVHRLSQEGLYVNIGIFPAVPETCAGIRFTINNHHSLQDIEKLVEKISFHLPKALSEENRSINDIHRSFKSLRNKEKTTTEIVKPTRLETQSSFEDEKFNLIYKESITAFDSDLWNSLFSNHGYYDWHGLKFLEEVFQNNERKEDNWKFHYYLITNKKGTPILATFFTSLFTKEDMLLPQNISMQIEEMRKTNEYYLTSKTFLMGTVLSDGSHLFLNREDIDWKEAVSVLLDSVWAKQEEEQALNLFLRDFLSSDIELGNFFTDQGFVKIDLPDSHVMHNLDYTSKEEYLQQLSHKKRKHIIKDVISNEHFYDIKINEKFTEDNLNKWYSLYENVISKNLVINNFKLPKKLFQSMMNSNNWDILTYYIKPQPESQNIPVAVGFAYKNKNYCPLILGIDYNYLEKYKVYKQILYQTLLRAINLKSNSIYWGLTASLEKRKLGAIPISHVAYIQSKDHYNSDVLRLIPNAKGWNKKSDI